MTTTNNITIAIKETYRDTRDNTMWTISAVNTDNNTIVLKGKNNAVKTLKSTKLFDMGILAKVETETTKKGRASLIKTEKASKDNNNEKMDAFIEECKNALSPYITGTITIGDVTHTSPYYFKWENNKRKLVLTYVDETTKQWKNVTELFYKVRFNSIHCFLRDEKDAIGLAYNATLASENRGRGYNFHIEYHMENTMDAINNFIKTVAINHIASVKGEN